MRYKKVKLGEICEFEGGSQPPKSNFIFEPRKGYTRFIQIRDFKSDKNFTYIPIDKKNRICKEEDVLIGRYGASVGKILTGLSGAYNVALMKTKPNQDKLDKKFLYYYLISNLFQEPLKKVSARSAQNGFSKDDIYNFPFALPSLEEQKSIVAKLDAAIAEIDKKKEINFKKLKYIDNLKEATLNSKIGKHQIKLSDACDLIKRGISPKYLENGGIAVINQKCIRNHKIDFSKTRRHNISLKKVPEERFIKKGDVLVNSTGQGTLGRVAQVSQELIEKTTVDSHVTIIRPKQILFNLDYFGKALIKIEKQLEAAGEGTSGQTELSRSRLENDFFIPYIESIDEQKKISHMLNNMFENIFILKNLLKKTIDNLEALKLSFLHKELNNIKA